jgi:NADH-ubiquinone oxidoreductase chain 6
MLIELNNGYSDYITDILYAISLVFSVFVIINKNPIVSVLYLIGLFLSIATYLIVIGISFIGISYLLVYVGAVSILFLFILMLINIRVSELLTETKNSIPLVFLVTILLDNILSKIFPENNLIDSLLRLKNKDINIITHNSWENNIVDINHITSIGNIMYTSYSIWLILVSIILLLAMVGAIVITIKDSKKDSYYTLPV